LFLELFTTNVLIKKRKEKQKLPCPCFEWMNEDSKRMGGLLDLQIWNHARVYNAWFCDLTNYKRTACISVALETVCKDIGRCAIRCQLTQHWNRWLTKPDQSIHCLICWSEITWSRISTPGFFFFLPIFKKNCQN
jgi:hypothetical protein